ncbi:MAG: SDR family oxidoreductase [Anaerolineae bacterium]|nr:SDR family oxidoreductase [Anaerolineae bacterium]
MTIEPSYAQRNLKDQVAIVTGGGRGLGRAFAQALASEGVKVAITARTEAELNETVRLIEATGGSVVALPADVTDRAAMQRVLAEVEQRYGPVDILVNNAAIITPLGYDWEVGPDEWWRTLEINVRGPYECTHMVLPRMIARRQGCIVNITSGAAFSVYPFSTAYCVSKVALSQWTNLLAAGVKDYGIRVFALGVGGPTAMIETIVASPKLPETVRVRFRAVLEKAAESTAIQDSARMLVWLVSGGADYLAGRHVGIGDSVDELVQRADDIVRDDLYTVRRRV